ncbi:hypothetical protein KRX11_02320 [Pasteurellaceae bacterium TAE3-ERU1]|nr:hypothetical protein [Pasteurellaceae bacterium TAE3-ERU1]
MKTNKPKELSLSERACIAKKALAKPVKKPIELTPLPPNIAAHIAKAKHAVGNSRTIVQNQFDALLPYFKKIMCLAAGIELENRIALAQFNEDEREKLAESLRAMRYISDAFRVQCTKKDFLNIKEVTK